MMKLRVQSAGALRHEESKEHIMKYIKDMGNIVSFASIFVSPKLTISDMEEVFKAVKSKPGRILVADLTTAKTGKL